MKTAIFKTSLKENEKRIPIYPEHLPKIPLNVHKELLFEEGYGLDYGYSDDALRLLGCNFAPREDLFKLCDILILPKPTIDDLKKMKKYQTLCGWTHAVQQREITDIAIEKKLTFLAWEEMFGENKLHIFYRNNELAGYAGVLHFLELRGMDGHYGERKKVIILGYGSVSRGAIYAFQGRGYNNIHVYTQREPHLVGNKNPDIWFKSFSSNHLYDDFLDADFILNGVLQKVMNPQMFIKNQKQLSILKNNTSIIDISCDRGMGFYFAQPTSFEQPIIELERGILYYSVDHTPTYLWNAASREISYSLIPYLKYIVDPKKWRACESIYNCIDIQQGTILNQNIIKFQKR